MRLMMPPVGMDMCPVTTKILFLSPWIDPFNLASLDKFAVAIWKVKSASIGIVEFHALRLVLFRCFGSRRYSFFRGLICLLNFDFSLDLLHFIADLGLSLIQGVPMVMVSVSCLCKG